MCSWANLLTGADSVSFVLLEKLTLPACFHRYVLSSVGEKKLPKTWPPVLPHWLLWLLRFSSECPIVLISHLLFHRSPQNKIHPSLSSAKLLPFSKVWNQIKCSPVIMFLFDHTSQISRVQSLGFRAQIVQPWKPIQEIFMDHCLRRSHKHCPDALYISTVCSFQLLSVKNRQRLLQ